jgi:glycolate oxidase FAD binding subunit
VGVTVDELLRSFAEEVGAEGPVAVEGRHTRWDLGGAVAKGTRVVRAPAGVLEHRPEEMTVRARAGTPVDELHQALAARGQRTALARRGGTVGGALAVGENDLSVLGRGRVRDALLQVRYVSAEGTIVTGGGPTVKNVTGFDLPRLLVGSLGTLGLIGEVVLRTNPVPPVSAWFRAVGADPFAVLEPVPRPSAVLWDGEATWVELEGHAADVEAMRRALASGGRSGDGWEERDGPPTLPPHRWSLCPAELRRLGSEATGGFVALVGVGTVFAARPQPPRTPAPGLAALCARVKHEFDPAGRLNPGRSVLPVAA